jgi:hypothetical protein
VGFKTSPVRSKGGQMSMHRILHLVKGEYQRFDRLAAAVE